MSQTDLRRRALDHRVRPTRAEIDLGALRRNLDALRSLAPDADVLAVVKANAYGHGATQVARALENTPVRMLGVALVEEGLELRNAGITRPILVLGGAYEGGYDLMAEHGLTPTVFRREHLEEVARASRRAGRRLPVHVKIDTGMGRLGVQPEDVPGFVDALAALPEIEVEGLLSHFANADLADAELTTQQILRFKAALAQLRAKGLHPKFRHLSNSAGIIDRPEVRDGLELNLVRPGIMLYGLSPAGWMKDRIELSPVLSWKTAITHLKRVPKGTSISYGATWVAPRESLIATLPVGYADGYDRTYSSRAEVLVRGRRAKIAGRVCMDMFMVDVTDVPGVSLGDEVVLIGAQGPERIGAEELAALAQTIHYEVLCAVGARVPRVVQGA